MENKDLTTKNVQEKESLTKKAGDQIERLGDKVSRAGAEKVGRAIHNLGDKIEHSRDGK